MTDSQKTYLRAKREALWSVLFFVVTVACGVWAVRAGLSDHWAEAPLWIAALIAFFAAMAEARETSRLMRLAQRHEAFEWERSFRPKF